jgi:hypothetical protein
MTQDIIGVDNCRHQQPCCQHTGTVLCCAELRWDVLHGRETLQT